MIIKRYAQEHPLLTILTGLPRCKFLLTIFRVCVTHTPTKTHTGHFLIEHPRCKFLFIVFWVCWTRILTKTHADTYTEQSKVKITQTSNFKLQSSRQLKSNNTNYNMQRTNINPAYIRDFHLSLSMSCGALELKFLDTGGKSGLRLAIEVSIHNGFYHNLSTSHGALER